MKHTMLALALTVGLLVGFVLWVGTVVVVGAVFGWIPATLVALLLPQLPIYLLRGYWRVADSRRALAR